ncbi:hypothetical protein R5W24_003790 [Gemmata sp. JC717]|uniref:hypothetical protein n=1 Tax=Gemmata algarum TaxID=2975278 RepID=UPI0021BB67AA|nr:hypothetical protein [Gemmata algarum]MDY3554664.1 hypothetical protein [Gemmata algarum]
MSAFDDEFGPPERPVAALKRVARYQRWLIAVVLGQLILWAGFVALAFVSRRGPAVQFPMVLTFILGAVGAVFVFLLSWELKGPFAAFMFAAATVLPCMGLIILTLVNSYASAELRRNGVRVGVFGASENSITDRPSLYDDEDAGW